MAAIDDVAGDEALEVTATGTSLEATNVAIAVAITDRVDTITGWRCRSSSFCFGGVQQNAPSPSRSKLKTSEVFVICKDLGFSMTIPSGFNGPCNDLIIYILFRFYEQMIVLTTPSWLSS